jgi:hypothetical protein
MIPEAHHQHSETKAQCKSNTNRSPKLRSGRQRPDGRSVRISTAGKSPGRSFQVSRPNQIERSLHKSGCSFFAFMSADWRLSFPVTSFWAWCHRIPSNNESTTNARILGGLRQPFERLLCRVHHYQERTLPCEAMTLVRVGIPGLARDGEWLAAAHSHFTSNRSNKPPVTLCPEGIDALYAPADAHV